MSHYLPADWVTWNSWVGGYGIVGRPSHAPGRIGKGVAGILQSGRACPWRLVAGSFVDSFVAYPGMKDENINSQKI